jgi:hypothetical protein
VLRPSYAWLLLCRAGNALTRFLETNAADQLADLCALPAYQQALARHRSDAEHCLARVMIRTGKPLDGLTGDELLHYADIVRTSGRHRREHLAWELMVALGVFAGEPATLRAAWSAKGNTRQHSVATLVDRYGNSSRFPLRVRSPTLRVPDHDGTRRRGCTTTWCGTRSLRRAG